MRLNSIVTVSGLLAIGLPHTATADSLKADIVVNGGSLAAPAAALAAARSNPSAQVLLVEPTDWLGGQATSQGVSAIDNSWFAPGAVLMRNKPSLYYPADYLQWLELMRNKPPGAPGTGMGPNGTCWVSREAFDPRTGAWALDQMTSGIPNLTVLKMTVLKDAITSAVTDSRGSASLITRLTLLQRFPRSGYQPFSRYLSQELPDWYSPAPSADFRKILHSVGPRDPARGLVVIDASETGDAIVLSGADYTVGREKTTEQISEDGTLPQMDEGGSQATVYPFCMAKADAPSPETELQAPWSGFPAYYQQQSTSCFSLGSYNWADVWAYRRLLNTGPPGSNTPNPGDVSMQNWFPGNDYPYGSIYLNREAAAAQSADWAGGLDLDQLAGAEKHAVAWYFWMKEKRTTTWDTRLLRTTDTMNMMGTEHGLAKFPYIRCGRRLVGLESFRITSRYFADVGSSSYKGGTSHRFYDSVGIGNYACDVHPQRKSSGISPAFEKPAPFYIPYRALGSRNVRNLLAAGKTIATTYITNSAYRLHPIEWQAGSAAGTASALMSRDSASNLDLLEISALRELQALVQQNAPISWAAYDASPIPPANGELILNDLSPAVAGSPFRAEVYHSAAIRARVYVEDTLVGESATRTNGRFAVDDIITSAAGTYSCRAELYGPDSAPIDILTASLVVNPAPPTGRQVVDDQNTSSCAISPGWTTASSQPDKWATTYRYTPGSGNAGRATRSATWILPITSPGIWEVHIWYPAAENRVTDTPFTIYHNGGSSSSTVRVDQTRNGGTWVSLGRYPFTGSGYGERLVMTNATGSGSSSRYVVADAAGVSFVSVLPAGPATSTGSRKSPAAPSAAE